MINQVIFIALKAFTLVSALATDLDLLLAFFLAKILQKIGRIEKTHRI